jgi:peptidylprolyl isomerase
LVSLKIGEIMKVRNGHTVKVHYKGTLNDGTEFDNSHVRGEPLNFEVGSRKLIRGFSEAVLGMSKGQTKKVTVPIEAAYGPHNPEAVQAVPRKAFAEGMAFEVGGTVQGNGPRGPFLARVQAVEDENITLDMNHPLAGKELNFEIELVSVHHTKKNTKPTT